MLVPPLLVVVVVVVVVLNLDDCGNYRVATFLHFLSTKQVEMKVLFN